MYICHMYACRGTTHHQGPSYLHNTPTNSTINSLDTKQTRKIPYKTTHKSTIIPTTLLIAHAELAEHVDGLGHVPLARLEVEGAVVPALARLQAHGCHLRVPLQGLPALLGHRRVVLVAGAQGRGRGRAWAVGRAVGGA